MKITLFLSVIAVGSIITTTTFGGVSRTSEAEQVAWMPTPKERPIGIKTEDGKDFEPSPGIMAAISEEINPIIEAWKDVKGIAAVQSIIGTSIYQIFDTNWVFREAKFAHLKCLARNREFEIAYYGKVR